MYFETLRPEEIESRSMAIISEQLGDKQFPIDQEAVVKRVIHTTADFEYAENLWFSSNAVACGLAALRLGCDIVCDTNMVKAGINKSVLQKLGGEVHCFMADEDVAAKAKERQTTRAVVSMEKAASLEKPAIFAIGNAPTALICINELIASTGLRPSLVIAVPVGFVNVVEAKELFVGRQDIPAIVARGRKGGSNVAAAICNALLYTAVPER